MSRKRYLADADPFATTEREVDTSAVAIDAELFGAIQKQDAHRQLATPIRIHEITPDPAQPRRTIPSLVRQRAHWTGDPREVPQLFETWIALVEEERGARFALETYLLADEETERPEQIGPLEDPLLELIALAGSIRREGLTNPITVARRGLMYQLETGERRWLAYHLLYMMTQDELYSRIAARTVEEINIWRQAAENNARANLNAISRARQFAMLLMNLLEQEKQASFRPIQDFPTEQAYYAQVADAKTYRVPRHRGDLLLAATGLKHKNQVHQYRKLLDLPNVVWQIADDLQWTERYLRDLREQARDDDDLIALALNKARAAGYKSPMGDLYRRSQRRPRAQAAAVEAAAPGTRQYYTQLTRLLRKVGPGRERANTEAVERLREMRTWLEEQEERIRRYR